MGLIQVDAYIFRCVLSNAKIEMMCADIPYVDYKSSNKKGYNPESKDYKKVVDLNNQLLEKMKLRQRESVETDDTNYETYKLS